MRFLMLVCRGESIAFSPADRGRIGPQVQAWVSEMKQRGVRLQGDVLDDVDATTNVRVRRRQDRARQWSARGDDCSRLGLESPRLRGSRRSHRGARQASNRPVRGHRAAADRRRLSDSSRVARPPRGRASGLRRPTHSILVRIRRRHRAGRLPAPWRSQSTQRHSEARAAARAEAVVARSVPARLDVRDRDGATGLPCGRFSASTIACCMGTGRTEGPLRPRSHGCRPARRSGHLVPAGTRSAPFRLLRQRR
jgi:hypothetical protein